MQCTYGYSQGALRGVNWSHDSSKTPGNKGASKVLSLKGSSCFCRTLDLGSTDPWSRFALQFQGDPRNSRKSLFFEYLVDMKADFRPREQLIAVVQVQVGKDVP